MSPVPLPTTSPATKSIALTTAVELAQVRASAAATTFVNCHLVAPPCNVAERKPIDVVVVLDKSGSMSGSKLHLCKQTVTFLSQQLQEADRVALVTYGSDVTTDLRLTKMTTEGKALLVDTVNAVHTDGMTNMSGGLMAGIDQLTYVENGDPPNPVRSILVLTDGQANQGVTTPDGLATLLQSMLPPTTSLHTFGYGSDHDAALLGQLADIGHGSYYFITNVDRVMLAFADCLGGLLSVVAQNIKLECVAAPGVLLAAVKTKRPITTMVDQVHVEVDIGDLYADETRDVLLQVQLTPVATAVDAAALVTFRLRYVNILESCAASASATATIDRPLVVSTNVVNEDVLLQKQRVVVTDALEEALAAAARGAFENAKDVLRRVETTLRTEATAIVSDAGQQKAAALVKSVADCAKGMASEREFAARGHGHMVQQVQYHGHQRWNHVLEEEEEECDLGGGDMFGGGGRNAMQVRMLQSALNAVGTSSTIDATSANMFDDCDY
ncbi:Aste57867_22997 [Aphanomyces stellatus]|uniref:Aste57867_22997 protein n=1 Tax=Aphanomyces stellatus TaxID=120398 RepID=A0A485LM15_9STRA|nr:hypothetical protein As57867_022926 [Aphanomyces stellatus]VFT99646.1 Aste57867_22997 [Aphanomyces stellatus]